MAGDVGKKTKEPQHEGTAMNNKFDELTKGMAQSITRRAALKKFGVGLAGIALGCFGVLGRANAQNARCQSCVASCSAFSGNTKGWCRQVECAAVCR
jgi:hypothetical protein